MPTAARTPRAVMWSGITRAGRRRAIHSSTRPSARARTNSLLRGASSLLRAAVMASPVLADQRSIRLTPNGWSGYKGLEPAGARNGRNQVGADNHAVRGVWALLATVWGHSRAHTLTREEPG